MATTSLIGQAGAAAVATILLLILLVTLLRLASLPLAMASLLLDRAADYAARPLAAPAPLGGSQ